MVYIVVKNLPSRLTLPQAVKQLKKVVKGGFEVINFGLPKGNVKNCYLKLSDELDPRLVEESIIRYTRYNTRVIHVLPKKLQLIAANRKPGKMPVRSRKNPGISESGSPDKVFVLTHREILTEMQMKYTGLYNLSKKTGHKLLEEIARTLFERLKQVSDMHPECLETGFKLSGAYRRMHPHFGDFQLILSTLHRLQDAAAAPRTQMLEADLIDVPKQPFVLDNVPLDKVQAACAKYSDRIAQKIADHVSTLKTEIGEGDPEEEIARKKVREELKKLTPYLPMIIRVVISNHFIPRKGVYHKFRIYGEPFMPNKDVMAPVIRRHRAAAIMRSDRMFNLLRLSAPLSQYSALMALDGTFVGAAKLVVRSSDMPTFSVPASLVAEMRASFGVEADTDDLDLADEEPAEPLEAYE